MGMGYHPASGLMLVAVGRLRPGTPATAAAFCAKKYKSGSSPKLWAFPDYETNALRDSDFYNKLNRRKRKPSNSQNNSDIEGRHYDQQKLTYQKPVTTFLTNSEKFRIISVYQMNVDEKCHRVFFVDVGVLNYFLNVTNVIQKPALLVYDLPPDGCESRKFRLIRRVEIPDRVASHNPFGILYTTIDYQSENCDDLYLYIMNFDSYLIVYDYKRNDFWHFTNHPTFQPITAESFFVYEKTLHYQLLEGLMSVALGYPDRNGDRTAYYLTGASTAQFAVSTRILKDKRKSPTHYNLDDFRIVGYRGCLSNAGKMAVDYTYGVIFYAERQSNRIRCWNMNKPLNPDNLGVVFESDKIQYPLTIFKDSRGYIWFNSCRLPILAFTNTSLDLNEVNNRFFRIKVRDAIRGTVCENN